MNRSVCAPLLAALLLAGPLAGAAAPGPAAPYDERAALAVSQAAIGHSLGEYRLYDRDGRPLSLNTLRGKPLVISLVYTSCHRICPMTTKHLAKVVAIARQALGEDSFRVVSIGFDTPKDNPQSMRAFARQQGVSDARWYFLSGGAETIQAIARDLGFVYYPSPSGFDHLIQASVIDAGGVVYRQVYGMTFDTPLLVEPLKELVYNRPVERSFLSGLSNRIRLFCTVYDPASDRYYFDYSLFIGMIIGATSLGLVVWFLVREWRRARRT